MPTEVKRLAETIRVTGVSQVLVTEIVDENGLKIRAFRIWGEEGLRGFPVLEVQLAADTEDAIKITTPEIKF